MGSARVILLLEALIGTKNISVPGGESWANPWIDSRNNTVKDRLSLTEIEIITLSLYICFDNF